MLSKKELVMLCFFDVLQSLMLCAVLSKLWQWFFVPTFGLPFISIPVFFGIRLFTIILLGKKFNRLESNEIKFQKEIEIIGSNICRYTLMIFLGRVAFALS